MSASAWGALKAGFVYAVAVFALGFGLGAIRIALVVPRFGETAAVLLEAPIMLIASWWVCLRCVGHFRVETSLTARSLMGLVAFVTLQSAEIGLAMAAFERSPSQYWLALWSTPGMIGLGSQIAFAWFPVVQSGTVSRRAPVGT